MTEAGAALINITAEGGESSYTVESMATNSVIHIEWKRKPILLKIPKNDVCVVVMNLTKKIETDDTTISYD